MNPMPWTISSASLGGRQAVGTKCLQWLWVNRENRTLTGPDYVITQWNSPHFKFNHRTHLCLKSKISELIGNWGWSSSSTSSTIKILTFSLYPLRWRSKRADTLQLSDRSIQATKIILVYFSDWLWKVLIKIPVYTLKLADHNSKFTTMYIILCQVPDGTSAMNRNITSPEALQCLPRVVNGWSKRRGARSQGSDPAQQLL